MKICLCLGSSLLVTCLVLTAPLRAQDSDGEAKPGFFHRLGNAIFGGTRKLEKSDTVDPAGKPATDDEAAIRNPRVSPRKPAPVKKPVPAPASKPAAVSKDDDSASPKNSSAATAPTEDAKPEPLVDKKDGSAAPLQGQGKDYPVATRSHKPGFVKSPFAPYHELDATGMISGSLARDPTNGKIFRVP
jgi:hypothetical protein